MYKVLTKMKESNQQSDERAQTTRLTAQVTEETPGFQAVSAQVQGDTPEEVKGENNTTAGKTPEEIAKEEARKAEEKRKREERKAELQNNPKRLVQHWLQKVPKDINETRSMETQVKNSTKVPAEIRDEYMQVFRELKAKLTQLRSDMEDELANNQFKPQTYRNGLTEVIKLKTQVKAWSQVRQMFYPEDSSSTPKPKEAAAPDATKGKGT